METKEPSRKLDLKRSKEIGEKLGFHHKTIERWARLGLIPSIRLGGSLRFDEAAVMAKLEGGDA